MRERLERIDYIIIFVVLCFFGVSSIVIYSATAGTEYAGVFSQHIKMFVAFFLLMLVIALFDYRILVHHLAYLSYGVGILLLAYVLIGGVGKNGSVRWIIIAGQQFQPSEIVKVALILIIAKLLAKRQGDYMRMKQEILPVGLAAAIPIILIMKQPDLGTAIVFICIFIGMTWMGSIRLRHLFIGLIIIALTISSIIALYFFDNDLYSKIVKPHQQARIQAFLDPTEDPEASYQVRNSMMAVGAGHLYGAGFKKGYYVQNGYIPYDYADSIYVVIGEEFGFLGSSILLLLYFLLIYRMVHISIHCQDIAGSYIIVGVISMIVFQVFENIAMHIGMMPLTGIALPFVSYGGTSLLTNMVSIGLVLSISSYQQSSYDYNTTKQSSYQKLQI